MDLSALIASSTYSQNKSGIPEDVMQVLSSLTPQMVADLSKKEQEDKDSATLEAVKNKPPEDSGSDNGFGDMLGSVMSMFG